jgi:hypothetical protein
MFQNPFDADGGRCAMSPNIAEQLVEQVRLSDGPLSLRGRLQTALTLGGDRAAANSGELRFQIR